MNSDRIGAAVAQLRAEAAEQRAEIERLRAENLALRERLHPRGKKRGGRPPKVPEDLGAQMDTLMSSGRSERDARSVMRQRCHVTSQGLGQALARIGWQPKSEAKTVSFASVSEANAVSFASDH